MELNDVIGSKYQILDIIKTSQNCKVGYCKNIHLNNEWLVKYIKKTGERELIEIKHLSILNHPKIPKVIDVIHMEEGSYYILEKMDGMQLDHYLTTHLVQITQAVDIIVEIIRIIHFIHTHGIIHGDLKPQNVLIDETTGVHIVDYGSSFTVLDSQSYTKKYVAPERLLDSYKCDEQSDVYSLGVIMNDMIGVIRIRHLNHQQRKMLKIFKKNMQLCLRVNPFERAQLNNIKADLLSLQKITIY